MTSRGYSAVAMHELAADATPAAADAAAGAGAQDAQPHGRTGGRTAFVLMLAAAILLGLALRLKHYLAQQPYWHDEASLVVNIFEKTAPELLGPLESAQAVAPGFLLVERGMHVLFDTRSELAMRLPPLLASIASVALFALLAWRMLGTRAPRVAVLLVVMWGCSERLIWHAAEAKQYSVDVFVTLLLLAIALRQTREGGRAKPGMALLICAAVAAVTAWFSHATAFLFGGISLALLPAMTRSRRGAIAWLACNALFGASFLALYFVSVRDQQVSALYEYWAEAFVPWSQPWMIPIWLVRQVLGIANYAFDLGGPVLLPLAIVGGYVLWARERRQRQTLAMLVVPALLVLVASALRQYPFSGSRLTLFLAPGVFLLAGVGLAALLERAAAPAPTARWLLAAVTAYLLSVAAWHALVYVLRPPVYGDMRSAVRYVAAHDAAGDIIYTNKISEFQCYWPDATVRHATELVDVVPDERFWVVLSYRVGRDRRVVPPLMREVVPEARQLDAYHVPGGTVLLFDGIDGPGTRPATAGAGEGVGFMH